MLKLVGANAWAEIKKLAERAKYKRAAIAYVSTTNWLPLGVDDELVVNASDQAIQSGATTHAALKKYHDEGVQLFGLASLHAKVVVLDQWAVVGSANASYNSATQPSEAVVISDSALLVGQAELLIHGLRTAAKRIDEKELARIAAIPVQNGGGGGGGDQPGPRTGSALMQRAWFASTHDAKYLGDEKAQASEFQQVRKKYAGQGEPDWIFFKSSQRISRIASVGDVIVSAYREHRKSKKAWAYLPARIVDIKHHGSVTNIYAIWRKDAEKRALSWTKFIELANRAHVRKRLTKDSTLELSAEQVEALEATWPKAAARRRA